MSFFHDPLIVSHAKEYGHKLNNNPTYTHHLKTVSYKIQSKTLAFQKELPSHPGEEKRRLDLSFNHIYSQKIMKTLLIIISFLSLSCTKKKAMNSSEMRSYLMGYKLGSQLKESLNDSKKYRQFLLGLKHSRKGKKPKISIEDLKKAMDQNKGGFITKEGKDFLEKNKSNPEVKTTSSGLQYKVIKEGKGKQPSATNEVEVHYKGTFLDGKEFDSSYKRNKSVKFPLNGVIKGWTRQDFN